MHDGTVFVMGSGSYLQQYGFQTVVHELKMVCKGHGGVCNSIWNMLCSAITSTFLVKH